MPRKIINNIILLWIILLAQVHASGFSDSYQSVEELKNSSQNLSRDFDDYFQKHTPLSFAELQFIKRFKIIFIPGFFSDVSSKFWVGYFDAAMDYLSDLGLEKGEDFDYLAIKSQSSPESNYELIYRAIAESDKKVILIGHSKGGADAVYAMVHAFALLEDDGIDPFVKASYRTVIGNLKGIITLQSPLYGTNVADSIVKHSLQRYFFKSVINLTFGDFGSMTHFTTAQCRDFMRQHMRALQHLKKQVHILNYTSLFDNAKPMAISILEFFRKTLVEAGVDSDGLVPTLSAVLKDTPFILQQGIDHTSSVVAWNDSPRRLLFQSLLKTFVRLGAKPVKEEGHGNVCTLSAEVAAENSIIPSNILLPIEPSLASF